ncbi:MAG: ubiquinone biosynthesis regulatory protein kinase UbiB [Cellvibrionaceae bacterium]|nr:ubiquinone biosynthesis regulatory protein kinase UbiB [Cellvibrionaceae bacterium]
MSSIIRLLNILHTAGRYRLDNLFSVEQRSTKLKLMLLPFKLYPEQKHKNRGQLLREAIEELGPIFIKFGQVLSTRPDLIAPDLIEQLRHLQDNVTPFKGEHFKAIVEKTLNEKTDILFSQFEEHPLASASIAQVHAAVLHSGEEVVIKVIRPGIEKKIDKDIKLLLLLAKLSQKFSSEARRLHPVEIVADYRDTIFDELDLTREAANASQLRRHWQESPLLYIPQVYWQYTRQNVMVMERIYGWQVTDAHFLKQQKVDLKLLAERGVEVFFTQVFVHNFFHADMHPGNVFVSKHNPSSPSYLAVDMAIIGSLSREDQYYLARNMIAIFRRDYRQVAELHVLSGWVPKSTSISGFEATIRSVCEPIFEKPLKEISFGETLITLFRTARRYDMEVQPQLVLLQKTLLNIEGLGRQLYPDLNLWDTAHPFLERWIKDRFHPKTLWKELKYNSPEWIEKFPEVPHLVFDTLQEVKQLATVAPQLRAMSEVVAKQKLDRGKRLRRVAALGIIVAGLYLGFNHHQPPAISAILILILAGLIIFI